MNFRWLVTAFVVLVALLLVGAKILIELAIMR